MIIDVSALSANKIYHTMIQTIVPRPVAWVLTDNGEPKASEGRFNLAPFSYFTPVSSQPPILMFSVGKKADGSAKDTRHNIEQRHQFVVHIASADFAQSVTDSSESLAWGDSEVDKLQLGTVDFDGFAVPRLADCAIAFACELYEIKEMGDVPQALIFGKVTKIYISDEVASEETGRLQVDVAALNPIGRLGGDHYWVDGRSMTIKRPL